MKFTINAKTLLKEIKQMKAAAPKKKTWILDCVKMGSVPLGDPDRIKITRTDTSTTISKYLECHKEDDGTICLNAGMLMDVLSRFTGDVEIEQSGYDERHNNYSYVTIKDMGKTYTLYAHDHTHWPILHESVYSHSPLCVFEASTMLMAVNKLHKLMSKDPNRAILTHIKMNIGPKSIIFASTDGKKVGEITIKSKYHNQRTRKHKDGEIIHREILISKEACKALIDNISKKDTEELCQVYTCNGEPVFNVGHTWIFATRPGCIQDNKYPMYENAFPESHDGIIVISKAALTSICNDAKMFKEATNGPKIRMTILNDRIDIHSKRGNESMAQSIVPDKIVKDTLYEYEIAFNPAFMLDIIHSISGDTVTIKLDITVKHSPLIITGDTKNERYLLMPMRIN